MATVTINLIGPLSGTQLGATVGTDDTSADIVELLKRADKAAAALLNCGWGDVRPGAGQAAQLTGESRFCGYICAPGLTEGFPAWLMSDGVKYDLREKQGDRWWSWKRGEDDYVSLPLRFRRGEQPPAVVGV